MSNYSIKYIPYTFNFNFPGGTSRGVLTQKQSWFIGIHHIKTPEITGWGEVSILPGLSPETPQKVESVLNQLCKSPIPYLNNPEEELKNCPAIRFGIEMALLDLNTGGTQTLFPSEFTQGKAGIRINGLIWMGDKDLMLQRIKEKLNQGFSCLKLKIGAIGFEAELDLLKHIRNSFSPEILELRVDANGAFKVNEALAKINALSKYHIHSIEQPIKQGLWTAMAKLCNNTNIPIALDEELIGIESNEKQTALLSEIKPQYLIFKPSLLGGLKATQNWSKLAEQAKIKWWVTSALESNIGLNAIAQWIYKYGSGMPQGLGTGQVFSNNIASPLFIKGESLWSNPIEEFKLDF